MRPQKSVAAAILVAAFSSGVGATDRAPEQIVAERCCKCHGPEGRSSNPDFPKLAGQNADYLTRQLANFKTGVRTSDPMQQEVAHLTGGEMRALALYLSAKEIGPEPVAARGEAAIGMALYFSGDPENGVTACITCHGPEGRGAMYLPRLAGQHAKYLVAQLHAFRDQSRVAPDMVMHTVIENVSDAGIVAVAQFLSGMK
ncbi:MAG: c-type cytochrome [Aromatoleum sp.]|uniref:c-type cytochrome n=1 Tax=Aromatoleum sp. TaxID=2307007 RepID=UPI0028941FEC|nr:c-type cytochrome [Aromatoleum sp.]MDT3670776.1 c-type cytochrome [Aromatoleum sp.]